MSYQAGGFDAAQGDSERANAADSKKEDGAGMSIIVLIVGGGLLLAALAVGILLVISFSHMTMPAKCSPLEEPVRESQIRDKTGECFKHDSDERVDADLKNKDKRCDKQEPDLFRSSVRVQVVSHRNGWGRTVLNPEAVVYDSAGDRWHINGSRQLVWAMSHCLCPGCNGTHPGECEECVPRSPGCDVLAPEYDCWMDVRTRSSGWPLYDTGVGRVRFTKEKTERNTAWWVLFIVFVSLFGVLLIAFIAVGVPGLLSAKSASDDEMPHRA